MNVPGTTQQNEHTSPIKPILTFGVLAVGILAAALVRGYSWGISTDTVAESPPNPRPVTMMATAAPQPQSARYIYFVGSEEHRTLVRMLTNASEMPVTDEDIVVMASREEAELAAAEIVSTNYLRLANGTGPVQAVALGRWAPGAP